MWCVFACHPKHDWTDLYFEFGAFEVTKEVAAALKRQARSAKVLEAFGLKPTTVTFGAPIGIEFYHNDGDQYVCDLDHSIHEEVMDGGVFFSETFPSYLCQTKKKGIDSWVKVLWDGYLYFEGRAEGYEGNNGEWSSEGVLPDVLENPHESYMLENLIKDLKADMAESAA